MNPYKPIHFLCSLQSRPVPVAFFHNRNKTDVRSGVSASPFVEQYYYVPSVGREKQLWIVCDLKLVCTSWNPEIPHLCTWLWSDYNIYLYKTNEFLYTTGDRYHDDRVRASVCPIPWSIAIGCSSLLSQELFISKSCMILLWTSEKVANFSQVWMNHRQKRDQMRD